MTVVTKIGYSIIFLFIFNLSHSQSNKNDLLLKKDFETLKEVKSLNFQKAYTYFFEGKTDSSFLYSSQTYNDLPVNSNAKNYLDYIYGVNAYNKGFYSLAEEKLKIITNTFPYKHLVDYQLGNVFLDKNDYKNALRYYNSAIESGKLTSNKRLKRIYHNIGACYLLLKEYDNSQRFLLMELDLSQSDNDSIGIIYSKLGLGNLFYEQYNDDLAIRYFKQAYDLATLFTDTEAKQITAKNMAVVENNRKRYKESVGYLAEAEKWKDSIWNRDRISELLEKDKQQAIAIKEKEIQIEKTEKELQQKQRNWFLGGFLLFLALFSIIFYIYRITLKQKRQLGKLNALKNFLLSVVSHDLRSPVNSIKANNDKILIALDDEDAKLALKIAKENQTASENTTHLLNNVLNWALKENNQLFYYPEEHFISELIKIWLYSFKNITETKGISIKTSLNNTCKVFIDKELMKIVFRNLVDNAIKYVPGKGMIHIESNQNKSYCELIISDNGPGVPLSILKEIENSEDLSKDKVNRSKGIGLGIILCKHLVKINKGTISFKNNNDEKGLIVTIQLPTTKS